MKLIYASGFSRSDRDNYRCIIFANILHSLKTILAAMEAYGSVFEIEENEVRILLSPLSDLTPLCWRL
jgi:guanine nucleotide-binding protein subunit alpha, other